MSVPWRDKRGVTHEWLITNGKGWAKMDNGHAGWYTARAPCGAERRLRRGRDNQHRSRGAEVDCMACIAEGADSA